MRSIGNDIKSSGSASSITQTHLDDLDEARDTHQAAAIAAEGTARNTAIITAVATETAARNTAIASETTARNTAIASETTARNTAITSAVASETTARNTAIATAHTEIVTDGYFDKIITSTTNISNMGFTNPDAAFAHKSHANVLSYALRQDKLGETFINTASGKKINFSILLGRSKRHGQKNKNTQKKKPRKEKQGGAVQSGNLARTNHHASSW